MTDLRIETPEGVAFSFRLATPVVRCLAWIVDAAAIGVLTSIAGKFTSAAGGDWGNALTVVAYFATSIGYGVVLEWLWRGQTIGKRVLRLRVIDAEGLRLHFSQIAIRNLLRAIDMLPGLYLVGGASAMLNAKGQRLGDVAANTVVVREGTAVLPALDRIAPARYNSLALHPYLAARLRSRVTPGAAAIAVRALVRRDSLDPLARVDLFRDLAGHFRSLVEFPDASVEGLTDEQYVRSVVRVLFSRA